MALVRDLEPIAQIAQIAGPLRDIVIGVEEAKVCKRMVCSCSYNDQYIAVVLDDQKSPDDQTTGPDDQAPQNNKCSAIPVSIS